MAKNTDIKSKTTGELITLLAEKRAELRETRFAAAGARAKDSNAPTNIRHDVARILTELAIREKTTV